MRIKTYLTIIVLVCLVGGYMTEYILGDQHSKVDSFLIQNNKNQLSAKDFFHLKQNVSQLLISVDLILGSDETYLIGGGLEQANLLIEQLKTLQESASIFEKKEVLTFIIKDIVGIRDLLKHTANLTTLNRANELASLLNEYDEFSLVLVSNLELLTNMIVSDLNDEAEELEALKSNAVKIRKVSVFSFLMLIFLLWYWANRQISVPLLKLSEMAAKVNKTGCFNGVDKGTKEVMLLSNELGILTNSLLHKANHDGLTDLFNRREFERQLKITFEEMQNESSNEINAVCYIDLDRFKVVNDSCGHAAGDELLKQVAGILSSNVRLHDVVARLGGDEFIILLKDCHINSATEFGNRFLNQIEGIRYKFDSKEFSISASIGITIINGNEENIEEIINTADSACALAKESGRNQVQVLDTGDERVDHKRRELLHLNEIVNAIDESRLVLFFQKIVPLNDSLDKGKHYEILVRLRKEDQQLVTPMHFLPIIERYQLSMRLDKWVFYETVTLLSQCPEEIESLDVCSINLSGQSLTNLSFLHFVIDILQKSDFPGHKLCFEITETAAISDIEHAMHFINELKKFNVSFALDDFGTGHSSFEYLKNLPIDYIKIDGSFVKDMLDDAADLATVKSITEVGKATGKKIVAEFVHSKEIADLLKTIGVDYVQGYYFMEPAELNLNTQKEKLRVVNS